MKWILLSVALVFAGSGQNKEDRTPLLSRGRRRHSMHGWTVQANRQDIINAPAPAPRDPNASLDEYTGSLGSLFSDSGSPENQGDRSATPPRPESAMPIPIPQRRASVPGSVMHGSRVGVPLNLPFSPSHARRLGSQEIMLGSSRGSGRGQEYLPPSRGVRISEEPMQSPGRGRSSLFLNTPGRGGRGVSLPHAPEGAANLHRRPSLPLPELNNQGGRGELSQKEKFAYEHCADLRKTLDHYYDDSKYRNSEGLNELYRIRYFYFYERFMELCQGHLALFNPPPQDVWPFESSINSERYEEFTQALNTFSAVHVLNICLDFPRKMDKIFARAEKNMKLNVVDEDEEELKYLARRLVIEYNQNCNNFPLYRFPPETEFWPGVRLDLKAIELEERCKTLLHNLWLYYDDAKYGTSDLNVLYFLRYKRYRQEFLTICDPELERSAPPDSWSSTVDDHLYESYSKKLLFVDPDLLDFCLNFKREYDNLLELQTTGLSDINNALEMGLREEVIMEMMERRQVDITEAKLRAKSLAREYNKRCGNMLSFPMQTEIWHNTPLEPDSETITMPSDPSTGLQFDIENLRKSDGGE